MPPPAPCIHPSQKRWTRPIASGSVFFPAVSYSHPIGHAVPVRGFPNSPIAICSAIPGQPVPPGSQVYDSHRVVPSDGAEVPTPGVDDGLFTPDRLRLAAARARSYIRAPVCHASDGGRTDPVSLGASTAYPFPRRE